MNIEEILTTPRLPVDADRVKTWLNSATGLQSFTVNGDEVLHLVPARDSVKATVFSATRRVATPVVSVTGKVPVAWRPVSLQVLKACKAL